MEYDFLVGSEVHKISIEKKEDIFVISKESRNFEADIRFTSSNTISILIEGSSFIIYFAREKDKRYFYCKGKEFVVQEPSEGGEAFLGGEEGILEDKLIVKAPMPGKVIKVNVIEKEEVRKNQTLAIVEAMKMENEIKSSLDGRVKSVLVSEGELVDSEKPLIELELKE
ncbi:MAG: acetyl-CoA carboxylase biotin carboxyl carrier protein subunit [Candidatus Aminicenantaceae bacterium]